MMGVITNFKLNSHNLYKTLYISSLKPFREPIIQSILPSTHVKALPPIRIG